MANIDKYDAYFKMADADQDGSINGSEAVAFFKGADLPQVVLSKIWYFSDQGRRGVLSKAEFFNALKLVTVAQSGRELTPEIVRAALFGPASSQIPPPHITSGPSVAPLSGAYGGPSQEATQPVNPIGQSLQVHSSKQSQAPKTVQNMPVPPQGQPGASFPIPRILTTDLGVDLQFTPKPFSPSVQLESASGLLALNLQASDGPIAINFEPKSTSIPSQQGLQEAFGGLAFQASAASQASSKDAFKAPPGAAPVRSVPTTTAVVAVPNVFPGASSIKAGPAVNNGSMSSDSKAIENSVKEITSIGENHLPVEVKVEAETSSLSATDMVVVPRHPTAVSAAVTVISQANPNDLTLFPAKVSPEMGKEVQDLASQVPSVKPAPSVFVQPVPVSGHGFIGGPWPKMTQSDIQRYSRVFTEVDTDRDGRILGQQARDLFLSWQLPREVLKQVWDLSDEDADSMLSFREFCTALYLMERYREGRPLPPVLPSGFHFEDDSQQHPISTGQIAQTDVEQHSTQDPPWQQTSIAPGLAAQELHNRPTQLNHFPQGASNQLFKSKSPVLEIHLVNQLTKDEQEMLKTKYSEAEKAENKVHLLEDEILDSQKKIEFYRSKLQEIILFKSSCDNRLAEAIVRIAADKEQVEILAKKYDEKFRQAGEVNSRLLAEEAAFRDIEERKMELYKAVTQIEQGGNDKSLLQTRADRISGDLDELKKALSSRIKQLGLQTRPLEVEPGFGWQPAMQETSTGWDDDWDKFDDEGFIPIQELMDDMPSEAVTSAKALNDNPSWDEPNLFTDEADFKPDPDVENTAAAHFDDAPVPRYINSGSILPQAESELESGKSEIESPDHDIFSPRSHPVGKSTLGNSATAVKGSERDVDINETQAYGDATFWPPHGFDSSNRSGDTTVGTMPSWAANFSEQNQETNPDTRASWGLKNNELPENSPDFNASQPARPSVRIEPSFSSHSFGDSLDFSSLRDSSPARVNGAPKHEYDFFGNSDSKNWQDKSIDTLSASSSVPGTPLFAEFSPKATIASLSSQETFSRFDSVADGRDRDRLRGLGSFDESDPFADTGPFCVRNQAPKSSDHWSTF